MLFRSLFSKIQWIDDIPKEYEGIIFCNELLDALPVDLIKKVSGKYYQKGIGVENDLLIWKEKEFEDVDMLDNFVRNKLNTEHYVLPVYFRVDLVRLIILLELATAYPDYYLIYSDLDTHALTKEQIFTEKTIELLNRFGLVLPPSDIGLVPYENSFHILAGKNVTNDKYMLDAIKLMLVYFNLYKISWF